MQKCNFNLLLNKDAFWRDITIFSALQIMQSHFFKKMNEHTTKVESFD